MASLKGFVTLQQLISNNINVVSPIGEMSTWSMTFTREPGEYSTADIPGYKLISTRYVDSDGSLLPLNDSLGHQVLEVVRAVYVYATEHLRPYDLQDLAETIQVSFYDRISGLNFGAFVDNDQLALPEWISWTSMEHQGQIVKIWLSDAAFSNQYDEYEIVVIPPITPVDNFFLPSGQVMAAVAANTIDILMTQVQEAKANHPETYIRTLRFGYVSSVIGQPPLETIWTVLIYGEAGDNIDAIKDAIMDFLLTQSSHPRSDWEAILPDIFKRTEFVLVPRWDRHSIPDMELTKGLYSPMVDPAETLEFIKAVVTDYPPSFVEANTIVIPHPYKELSIIVVNGRTNVSGKQRFDQLFYDYISVGSSSLDFNRMQPYTREWLLMLEEMLIVAETMSPYSSTPRGTRKIIRNSQLYLSRMYDNVNYLILSKHTMLGG